MAGGMSRGPTLAERNAVGAAVEVGADPELAALQDRPRPVLTRHCWVTGLPDCPGRWAGGLQDDPPVHRAGVPLMKRLASVNEVQGAQRADLTESHDS